MSEKTTTRPQTANISPFGLRMQPELKELVESAAKANGRSMNAEVVARLERSFSTPEKLKDLLPSIDALVKAQERQEIISNALIAALIDGGKADASNEVLNKALKRLIIDVGVFDHQNHKPGEPESAAHRLLEAGIEQVLSRDAASGNEHARSAADEKFNKVTQEILKDAKAKSTVKRIPSSPKK